jgi:hypothetical protein
LSHIVTATTEIENPDPALLRQATELVAQQYPGGEIRTYYLTYEGDQERTPLAIATSTMHRGMAIQVKDKKLTFIGDSWGYRKHYAEVQQQIIQTYVSLATIQALANLGYQVTTEDGEEAGQIVISGVTYA